MRYRLIAMDLDGTLLTSQKAISAYTLKALGVVRARGITMVIATGRTLQSASYWSRRIGGGPVIACNGAAILDEKGALLVQREIPRESLHRMLEISKQCHLLAECYTRDGIVLDQPLQQMRSFIDWSGPQRFPHMLMSLVKVWRVNRIQMVGNLLNWARRSTGPPVLKLFMVGEQAALEAAAGRIRAEFPGQQVSSSGDGNLEITASGVHKGSGLCWLGERLQIPPEAILAVGDSLNDLEMLQYAAMGVAMGNADERVKRVAARVTASCDEDGVARLVEEFCL